MKKLLSILLISGLVTVALVGGCGWSGYSVVQDTLHNKLKFQSSNFKFFQWCFNGLPFVDQLDNLLANKTYIVLLQNNRELRPSGGFMGSYAKIRLASTGLAEFTVQDIYVPDGQISGHVDPPLPIQQAFGQGWWRLRDSNWDPDFTVAAPQIAWFFAQGGEKIDGLVAVNLSLVAQALQVLGEIKPTDYGDVVTAKTFYILAQKYAEVGFFPGSTQKRDFLGAVGNALLGRIINSTAVEKLKLAKVLLQQLKSGEILIWFKDQALQNVVAQRHWDGGLGSLPASGDYLYLVETNLGANKANCCVSRQVVQTIDGQNENLRINYTNQNPFENPKPPLFWGGNYLNYLRIVVPAASQIQSVMIGGKPLVEKPLDNQYGIQEDGYQIEDRDKFKIVGFWAVVPAGNSLAAVVEYSHERHQSLVIKKQPGVESFLFKLIVDGKEIASDTIDRDKEYRWTK